MRKSPVSSGVSAVGHSVKFCMHANTQWWWYPRVERGLWFFDHWTGHALPLMEEPLLGGRAQARTVPSHDRTMAGLRIRAHQVLQWCEELTTIWWCQRLVVVPAMLRDHQRLHWQPMSLR